MRHPEVIPGALTTLNRLKQYCSEVRRDIAGFARQALADPDWFLKVKLGQGDQIRRCNYTNYCEALDQAAPSGNLQDYGIELTWLSPELP